MEMSSDSTVIVRTGTNEYNVLEMDGDMSVGGMMKNYFAHSPDQLYAVQRDAQGRVASLMHVSLEEAAISYASKLPTKDASLNEEQLEHDCFLRCHLWVVKNTVRVFFNPYIRMVLGLSQWYLDLPADEAMKAMDLELFVRECLQVSSDDNRFALYGNYRSHVSVVDGEASVLRMTATEDEPGPGAKFWQFMMKPEAEDQSNLGIARQSILWVQEPSSVLGSRRYWCTLQGTTLFYFREQGDLESRKAITNLDHCQILYRGGNKTKGSYSFEIVTLEGDTYRCKSPSRRRIEKWIRFLKRCHRSLEINEPVTMEMIAKLTAPQTAPIEPSPATAKDTKDEKVVERAESHHHAAIATAREEKQSLQHPPDNGSPIDMETMLRSIGGEAELLYRAVKLRQRDAHHWIEQVRTFIIGILRIDHPSYIFNVVPLVKELIGALKNFSEGASGNSEFIMTPEYTKEHVENILDLASQLMFFYRDALLLGPDAEDEELMEDDAYDRHRQVVQKIRRALGQPISKINLRNLKIKQTTSIDPAKFHLGRRSSTRDDGSLVCSEKNRDMHEKQQHVDKVGNDCQKKKGMGGFFLDLFFKRGDNGDKDNGQLEQERSKRKARIPEEEAQELSMHSSSHVESNHSAGHGAGVESSLGVQSVVVSPVIPMAERHGMKKEQFWREQLEQEQQGTPKTPTTLWSLLGIGSKSSSKAASRSHSRKPSVAKSESSSIVNAADDEMEESILRFKRTASSGFFRPVVLAGPTDNNLGITNSNDGTSMSGRHRPSRSLTFTSQTPPLATPPPPSTTGLIIDETGVTSSPGGYSSIFEEYDQAKTGITIPTSAQCQPTPLQNSISVADHERNDPPGASDPVQDSEARTGQFHSPLPRPKNPPKVGHRRCLSMRPAILITPPTGGGGGDASRLLPPANNSVDTAKDRPMSRRRPNYHHHHPDHPQGAASLGRRRSIIEIDQVLLNALLKDPRLAKLINPTNDVIDGSSSLASSSAPSDQDSIPSTPYPQSARESGQEVKSEAVPPSSTRRVNRYLGNCEVCHERLEETVDVLQTPFAAFHRACLVCDLCGQQLTTQSFRLEGGKARCRIQCRRGLARMKVEGDETNQGGPARTDTPLKSILKKPTCAMASCLD